MDWLEIEELGEIDLPDSYLLGWTITPNSVEFQLDVVLCKNHPKYTKPQPDEWACFHRGRLLFQGVQSLIGLSDQSIVSPFTDAAGEHDYGHIDALSRNGDRFRLAGDFGEVTLTAQDIHLVLCSDK